MTSETRINVDPTIPHYLSRGGEPVVLVASSEHYGAIINLDFDVDAYLDKLAEFGMNYTRVYPGAYFETDGWFVPGNTLGPRPGRHCLPWSRSDKGTYVLGGPLFDLDSWNSEFFERFRRFAARAEALGIVVEVCFFNAMYEEMWPVMPMNAANNVQGVGTCDYTDVQSFEDPELVRYQEAYVRKIVRELTEFDNIVFEIVDEPGIQGALEEVYAPWVLRMVHAVRDEQASTGARTLVAQQISGTIGGAGDFSLDDGVDIATGQYVWTAAGGQLGGMRLLDSMYHHDKPIELNESTYYPGHFNNPVELVDDPALNIAGVRVEAWEFVVGGGAAYNHLNANFSTDDATGSRMDTDDLLAQLQVLARFIHSFNLRTMRIFYESGGIDSGSFVRCIAEAGSQYAAYLHHSELIRGERYRPVPGAYRGSISLSVPAGEYRAEWIAPATGEVVATVEVRHGGNRLRLAAPEHAIDIALRVTARAVPDSAEGGA